MYLTRFIEAELVQVFENFKITLLLGARQVGKSTLLKHLFPKLQMLTLDPGIDVHHIRADPDFFLKQSSKPLILDEVQYAPELLSALKRHVDQSSNFSQYILTGSQNVILLKSVAESMAGRVGIIHMHGMLPFEMYPALFNNGAKTWIEQWLEAPELLVHAFKSVSGLKLVEVLWRGSNPGLVQLKDAFVQRHYASFFQTYVERDIRLLDNIRDVEMFSRFVGYLAAVHGQQMNTAQISIDLGISRKTVSVWSDLLKHTYQWQELQPYSGNLIKRLIKRSKGYFNNAGLVCYLRRFSKPEALLTDPQLGALFEGFVIQMIQTNLNARGIWANYYYWRTEAGAEVDLIVEVDGALLPIEIKCKSTITRRDVSGLKAFMAAYGDKVRKPGIVVYAGDQPYWIEENILVFPWDSVLKSDF